MNHIPNTDMMGLIFTSEDPIGILGKLKEGNDENNFLL